MSLIIGIDPGSRLTGYGIIKKDGQHLSFIDAGTIRTETTEMPERLKRIFAGIDRIVRFHGPTEAAVEQVFMAQNPDSALKLGQGAWGCNCRLNQPWFVCGRIHGATN